MKTTVVVGNPKPQSRTLEAALLVAQRLGANRPNADQPNPNQPNPDQPNADQLQADQPDVVDVITLGSGLLGWGDSGVADAVARVSASDLVIVASPTYKGAYTGVLKLFLDQFSTATGLAGVVAVPLMLGAGPGHALAPELVLKPVLVELGATCPTQGLYLLDSAYADGVAVDAWVEKWGHSVWQQLRDD